MLQTWLHHSHSPSLVVTLPCMGAANKKRIVTDESRTTIDGEQLLVPCCDNPCNARKRTLTVESAVGCARLAHVAFKNVFETPDC